MVPHRRLLMQHAHKYSDLESAILSFRLLRPLFLCLPRLQGLGATAALSKLLTPADAEKVATMPFMSGGPMAVMGNKSEWGGHAHERPACTSRASSASYSLTGPSCTKQKKTKK